MYKSWLDNLFDGAYVVDNNRIIVYWNKAAENLTGYTESEIIGKACSANILRALDVSGRELCLIGCPSHETLHDSQPREAVMFLLHKQGHRIPVHSRISPVKNENGETTGAIGIFSDQSRDSQIIKELERHKKESLLDPLLGIGNRRYAETMFQIRQYEMKMTGVSFGIMFMDVDRFKAINDVYGHPVGDKVLLMVSQTTANLLRHFDTFVRWGGDEFLILCLPNVATQEGLQILTERIKTFVESSFFTVGDKQISVTVSIGATFVTTDDTLEAVVERADSLMYSSKTNGGSQCTIG